jgi:hypothetical protein
LYHLEIKSNISMHCPKFRIMHGTFVQIPEGDRFRQFAEIPGWRSHACVCCKRAAHASVAGARGAPGLRGRAQREGDNAGLEGKSAQHEAWVVAAQGSAQEAPKAGKGGFGREQADLVKDCIPKQKPMPKVEAASCDSPPNPGM